MLNDGLETLGDDTAKLEVRNGLMWPPQYSCNGVFACSGIERVVLPSTLRKLSRYTFSDCKELKGIQLPAGLE